MKSNLKYRLFGELLVTSIILTSCLTVKENEQNQYAVKTLISSKHYLFKASTATPSGGGLIQLNSSNYDLVISPKSIQCYLPFFGKAYVAPSNPSEGGIKFSSTDFEYTEEKTTKQGWSILIRPNDQTDVRLLRLEVFKNGHASLAVTSTNRQQMLFDGMIQAAK